LSFVLNINDNILKENSFYNFNPSPKDQNHYLPSSTVSSFDHRLNIRLAPQLLTILDALKHKESLEFFPDIFY
jgi:hypothetical protein